jgi:aminodeoxyfutalosine synthase
VAQDPEGLEGMSALAALAERIAQGAPLTLEDAPLLAGSHDLIAVGMMADEVRRRLHGRKTTFVRVFEMHVDAVPEAPPHHLSAGEFRIVGRPASLDTACAAVAVARRIASDLPLTGFSLHDVLALDPSSRQTTFERLKAAGLDAVAETAVDDASTSDTAIEAARSAGLHLERLTVRSVPRDWIALFGRVLDLQRTPGGFRAFAPLPRTVPIAAPTTGYDDVKVVALSRLLLRDVPSIQVDWPLYGPKLAQVALTVGADDVDGIVAIESGTLGVRRSAIEEINLNIRAAGLDPVERDGRYERRHDA